MSGYQFSRERVETNIPAELRARRQWLGWSYVQDPPKNPGDPLPGPRKVPIDPKPSPRYDGRVGSVTDPATWGTFGQACDAVEKYGLAGIGYLFTADDPYCGFDFDHVREPQTVTMSDGSFAVETYHINSAAGDPINLLAASGYSEVSQSGTGVHVVLKGTPPRRQAKRNMPGGWSVESYFANRFFAVTGEPYRRSFLPLPESNGTIPKVWAMLGLDAAGDEGESATGAYAGDVRSSGLSIDDAIIKARGAKNGYGKKFADLFDLGNLDAHNRDHSAGDMALVRILAFYLGLDPERIDQAFRRSKLYRSKWDRADYRDTTIGKVLRQMVAEGSAFYGDKIRDEKAADEPKREFHIYTMGDYRKRPAPDWQIKGIARRRSIIGIVGDFGTFKSFVALDKLLSEAHGLPWFGYETTQCPTLYIMGEGSGGIAERVDAWNRHHGCEDSDNFYLLPGAPQLLDDKDLTALIEAIRALPQTPHDIALDTLARTFGAGNENSQEDMGRYVAAADKLREEFDATVTILHHNNKQGEYRGSTVMPAALDTMIGTELGGEGVILQCLKQKDFEPFAAIRLKKIRLFLDDGPEPGADTPIDFDRPSSLVFEPIDRAESMASARPGTVRLTDNERKLLQALTDSPKAWVSQTEWANTAALNMGTVSRERPKLIKRGFIEIRVEGTEAGKERTFARITEEGRNALDPTRAAYGENGTQADWSAPFRGPEKGEPEKTDAT